MKWVGYLLLLAILIAALTVPSQSKFEKFVNDKVNSTACKPSISHYSYKIFSLDYVSECTSVRKIQNLQTGEFVNTNIGLPVYGTRKKYLGLFGRFWKL
jgi:hypothetical protein